MARRYDTSRGIKYDHLPGYHLKQLHQLLNNICKQENNIIHKQYQIYKVSISTHLLMNTIRPVNEPNVHELLMNLFGGKFVYLLTERTRTKKIVRLIK
ncbi:hypothetical protein Hanom_Chr09g00786971 [Helianthus anomalus]